MFRIYFTFSLSWLSFLSALSPLWVPNCWCETKKNQFFQIKKTTMTWKETILFFFLFRQIKGIIPQFLTKNTAQYNYTPEIEIYYYYY